MNDSDAWTPLKEIGTRDLLREVQARHPRGCVFVGVRDADSGDGEDAYLCFENRFAARDLCRLALRVIQEPMTSDDDE